MKNFTIKLTAITLVIGIIGWLVFSLFLPQYYFPALPFLLLFLYLVTISIHAYQLNLARKDLGKFPRTIMLVTFIKLILYSTVAIVYIALDKENAIPFVICLMVIYLVFTFVEVRELARVTRSQQK